jgi:Carboxypeptidase regulatory-like domain
MTSAPARIAAVLAAGLFALLPACTQQPGPDGVVTGLLIEFGGPSPGIRLLVPGHVTATSPAATQTVTASRHGRFRFSLPPGVYHLTAQSGGVRCGRVRAVRVRPGTVTRGANVTCSVP